MTAEYELKEGNNKSHAEREPTKGPSFWSGDVMNATNTAGSAYPEKYNHHQHPDTRREGYESDGGARSPHDDGEEK